MRALVPLLAAASIACGTGPTQSTLRNQGSACVDTAAGTITVDFETCLSSSCDTLLSASCTARWNVDAVELEAEAVIESAGPGTDCTTDCGFVTATCDLPDEADPSGNLVYGSLIRAIADIPCDSP